MSRVKYKMTIFYKEPIHGYEKTYTLPFAVPRSKISPILRVYFGTNVEKIELTPIE